MKLFVWKDMLHDYWPGMAVAVAETKAEAVVVLMAQEGLGPDQLGELMKTECVVEMDLNNPKPGAWYEAGGS